MTSASQYVFLQSQGTERGGGREHGELHAAFLNASTHLSLTNVSFLAVADVRGECSVIPQRSRKREALEILMNTVANYKKFRKKLLQLEILKHTP